jgi:methyl-accepting chemotaxis protein
MSVSERVSGAGWKRFAGAVIQVTGVLGLIICLVGAVGLPLLAGRVSEQVHLLLLTAADGAANGALSIRLAGDSLGQGSELLRGASTTVGTINSSLGRTQPVLLSVGAVVGEEFPTTIVAASEALRSAQSGAASIDRVLRAFASLDFITGISYDPEKSLDQSLSDVAAGLEPLPTALAGVQDDFDVLADALSPVQASLEDVADDLGALAESLDQVREQTDEQAAILEEMAEAADRAATRTTTWVWAVFITIDVVVVLLGVEQLAIITVGRQLRREGRSTGEV